MINELRIGNWLNISNTETDTTVTASTFSIGPLIKVNYKPIELDDFWLKRFGFENIRFKYEINRFIIWYDPRSTYYHLIYEGNSIEIKYVHQLQNLYYFLTYNELEITKNEIRN